MKQILLATVFTVGFAGAALAQSLIDQLNGGTSTSSTSTIRIAAGVPDKANYHDVLPRIATFAVPEGLNVVQVQSSGSVQSAAFVCLGTKADAAIGQADAFNAIIGQTECAGKYEVIGQPLYGYYGYAIALANPTPEMLKSKPWLADGSLQSMVNDVQTGSTINVADGKVGSGGQVTFGNMLSKNPDWKNAISEQADDATTGESELQDGDVDVVFVMDSPASPFIQNTESAIDPTTKKPLYRFLDVRPGDDFFAITDWNSKPLYSEVTLSGNFWTGKTKTVETDAVVIVNTAWANDDANSAAMTILRDALGRAESKIRAVTGTPKDWDDGN